MNIVPKPPKFAINDRVRWNLNGDEVTVTGVQWINTEGGDWLYSVMVDGTQSYATMTERHLLTWNSDARPRFEKGDVVRYAVGSGRVGRIVGGEWNGATNGWVYGVSDSEHGFADTLSESFLVSLIDDGEKGTDAAEPTVAAPETSPRSVADMLREAEQAAVYAAAMRRQAAEMQLALEAARLPKMPEVDGDAPTFVVFSKYQSGRSYAYAAVGWKHDEHIRWTVTGNNRSRMNWTGLLQFIGAANWPTLAVVSKVENIGPPANMEPAVVETMGDFGRVSKSEIVAREFQRQYTRPGRYGGEFDGC